MSSSPVLSHRSIENFQIEPQKSISPQHKNSLENQNGTARSLAVTPSMSRKSSQRATVTKKTRTYVVDGVEGLIIFCFF